MNKPMSFGEFIDTSRETVQHPLFMSVLEKVNVYNKREMIALGYGVNESFRSRYKINNDIQFSIDEQEEINVVLNEILEHLKSEMENKLALCEEILRVDGNVELIVENKFTDAIKKISSSATSVAHKVGDDIKATSNNLVKWAKETKKDVVEKYKNTIEFVEKLIAKGIDSVKKLIAAVAEMFSKLGDNLSDALDKLGAFDAKDGEKPSIDIDNAYTEDVNDNQKNFFGYVVEYIHVMLGDHKDRAEKLMTEGLDSYSFDFSEEELLEEGVIDKIANNKVIQFIFCYGKDKKISFWKSLLISIVGSLIIAMALPLVLNAFGVGVAAAASICTAVSLIWNAKGIIKILLNRYVNKKEGEKFFDKATTISLIISVTVMGVLQIPAVKEALQHVFASLLEKLHIDNISENLEDWWGQFVEKIKGVNPKTIVEDRSYERTIETIVGGQKIDYAGDIVLQRMEGHEAFAKITSDEKMLNIFDKLANSLKGITKSTQAFGRIQDAVAGTEFPQSVMLDANKWGVPAKVFKDAISKAMDQGVFDNSVVTNLIGDELHSATNGVAGACTVAINMSDAQISAFKDIVVDTAKSKGVDVGNIIVKTFGEGTLVPKITETVKDVVITPVHNLFDTMVACFNPVYIPILDKKTFGKYKMSFGSNTKGYRYYTVSKVEHMKIGDVDKLQNENVRALTPVIEHLKDVQKRRNELVRQAKEQDKEKNDGKVSKEFRLFKKREDADVKFEDNEVLVIYIKANYDEDGKKIDKEKEYPGVLIDLTTMLAADIAPFRKKNRKYPYFLKGLMSRLSFRPVNSNDNETKNNISEWLGTTMNTACKQCYSFGLGHFYIEYDKDKKEFKASGKDDENKTFFDLGNFSPNELCEILNSKDDYRISYDRLSGKEGSRVVLRMDKKGNLIRKVRVDTKTIENARYRRNDAGRIVRDSKGDLNFVQAKIYPELNNEDTDVHNRLYDNDKIRELFFKKDSKEINDKMLSSTHIEDYLYRPEKSFSKKDYDKLSETVGNYLNDKEEKKSPWYNRIMKKFKDYDDVYDTVKKAVEIIWDELEQTLYRKYLSEGVEYEEETTLYDILVEEAMNVEFAKDYVMSFKEFSERK